MTDGAAVCFQIGDQAVDRRNRRPVVAAWGGDPAARDFGARGVEDDAFNLGPAEVNTRAQFPFPISVFGR